jgi:hypothetical protein
MRDRFSATAALLALSVAASGCVAAAAAAGAGAGIYLTNQGAESLVDAPIATVAERARIVMQQMNIAPAGTQMNGDGSERELKGKTGDTDITIELEAQSASTTRLEVTARDNLVNYDKEMARDIVERIVAPQ